LWTSKDDADVLLEELHANGVPAGRIYRAKDMFSDPHFAAREAIIKLVHPQIGELAMHNVFPRLSETPGKVRTVGPMLGEHNDEIYKGLLGLDDAVVTSLRSAGII
jgi:formyl-CoA transferase